MRVEGNLLVVEGVDVLDETPLLGIKPYVLEFECTDGVRIGWLEQARGRIRDQRADDRFG